jgi:hypothetical protein
VWRILKRLELNRLPASQRHKRHDRRWKRYEKPLPGHRVQIDVTFIADMLTAADSRSSKRLPVRSLRATADRRYWSSSGMLRPPALAIATGLGNRHFAALLISLSS